jgi:hypothetical protein
MRTVRATDIRYRVDPGDIPPEKAARRLHLPLQRFNELLPDLLKRGFPAADPTTGNFDLDAINLWRKDRHGSRDGLTTSGLAPQPNPGTQPGMADRFIAHQRTAKERGRRRGTA